MSLPLRYNISDWHQLVDVQSNNSRKLHIVVTDLIQSDVITGMQISVVYSGYQFPLFSYTISASGTAVTPNIATDLTKTQILDELAKYGFLVTFNQMQHLPADLITYLQTLNNLGFDKIRKLTVTQESWGKQIGETFIVAFMVDRCPEWLANEKTVQKVHFQDVLYDGGAINLTPISTTNQWDWSWLTFVANIDDILMENTE